MSLSETLMAMTCPGRWHMLSGANRALASHSDRSATSRSIFCPELSRLGGYRRLIFRWMQTSKASFEMLWRAADEILQAVSATPEGASERTMVQEFEERGFSAEMFYGMVAELENEGLVRWHGNWLFRALVN